MRADAESAVWGAGPVFQVMYTLKPTKGPVGDFVVNIPAFCETLGRLIVKSDVDLIVLKFRIATTPGTSLFPVEHVDRNVLGPEPLNPVEILFPHLVTLVWQTGNQVHTDVVEATGAKRFEIV